MPPSTSRRSSRDSGKLPDWVGFLIVIGFYSFVFFLVWANDVALHPTRRKEMLKLKPRFSPSRIYPPRSLENLKPRSTYKFFYETGESSSDPDVGVLADLEIQFFGMKAVSVEKFRSLVYPVQCQWQKIQKNIGLMKVEFQSREAFRAALEYWPIDTADPFLFVTRMGGTNCQELGYRGFYTVRFSHTGPEDDSTPEIYLEYEMAKPAEVIDSLGVNFYDRITGIRSNTNPSLYPRIHQNRIADRYDEFSVNETFDALFDLTKEKVIKKSFNTGKYSERWKSSSPFGPAFRIIDTTKVEDWPEDSDGNSRQEKESDALEDARAKWTPGLGVWCVDCYAKGNLRFRGSMKYHTSVTSRSDRGFRELRFSLRGDMEQKVNFGLLLATRTQNGEKPAYKKQVAEIHAIEPFEIPYLFSIGISVPIEVGVNIRSEDLALTEVGATLIWPNMTAEFDIMDTKDSYNSSGWWPEIHPTKESKVEGKGKVAAGIEFYANTKLQVSVEIFDSFKDTAGISHTTTIGETIIRNRPDLAPGICNGTKDRTDYHYLVEAFAETKGRDFRETLYEDTHNLLDTCPEALSIKPHPTTFIPTDVITTSNERPFYQQPYVYIGFMFGLMLFRFLGFLCKKVLFPFLELLCRLTKAILYDIIYKMIFLPLAVFIWNTKVLSGVRIFCSEPKVSKFLQHIPAFFHKSVEVFRASLLVEVVAWIIVRWVLPGLRPGYNWFFDAEEKKRDEDCACVCRCPCRCPETVNLAKRRSFFHKLKKGGGSELWAIRAVFAVFGFAFSTKLDAAGREEYDGRVDPETPEGENRSGSRPKSKPKHIQVVETEVAETPVAPTDTDPLLDSYHSDVRDASDPRSPTTPSSIAPRARSYGTGWSPGSSGDEEREPLLNPSRR